MLGVVACARPRRPRCFGFLSRAVARQGRFTLTADENQLIELLPRKDRKRLLDVCESVHLALGDVLCERGQLTRHAYFPVDGFISLVTQIDGHPSLEVGMAGREGMLGVQLLMGVPIEPLRALVQGEGAAWRIGADAFREELAASQALQDVLNRYLYVLMSQLARSTACLRFHLIVPRLARWLLMSQDRSQSDTFFVTHEFLACMLGVRRVGITVAAGALQRQGLINYHRGEVTILDRTQLEEAACDCYAADQRAYGQLFSARSASSPGISPHR